MAKKRPNPGWTNGAGVKPAKAGETAFETITQELGLEPTGYVSSGKLRAWAEKHKNQRYIPEGLLRAWGIEVNPYFGRGLH
jgi:hypothetical protein